MSVLVALVGAASMPVAAVAVPPVPPTAFTTGLTHNAATLTARAETGVTYKFEYGKTETYGQTKTASAGASPEIVQATLTGLEPSTLYHFRIVATNAGGESANGADGSFTTKAAPTAPVVVNSAPTNVAPTSGTVNAMINPTGDPTTYVVQFGTTDAYGSTTTSASAGAGYTSTPATASLTDLAPATTYHYRFVATNSLGVTNGPNGTFTTPAVPPPAGGGTNPTVTRPAGGTAVTGANGAPATSVAPVVPILGNTTTTAPATKRRPVLVTSVSVLAYSSKRVRMRVRLSSSVTKGQGTATLRFGSRRLAVSRFAAGPNRSATVTLTLTSAARRLLAKRRVSARLTLALPSKQGRIGVPYDLRIGRP